MAPVPYPCVATHIPCNLTPDGSLSPVSGLRRPDVPALSSGSLFTAFNRHVFEY